MAVVIIYADERLMDEKWLFSNFEALYIRNLKDKIVVYGKKGEDLYKLVFYQSGFP